MSKCLTVNIIYHCDKCQCYFASQVCLNRHNLRFHPTKTTEFREPHPETDMMHTIFSSNSDDNENKSETSDHSDDESDNNESDLSDGSDDYNDDNDEESSKSDDN